MSTEGQDVPSVPSREGREVEVSKKRMTHLERTTEDHVFKDQLIERPGASLLKPTDEYSQSQLAESERKAQRVSPNIPEMKSTLVNLPTPPCDLETYTITQLSAEGGTARIYRALESHSKDHVAIKLLRRRFHQDPIISALFLRHGAALKQIQLPHFANVLDAGDSEWGPWWAIEWVEGQTLREVIDQGAHWSSDQLLRLMLNLCDALEGLHQLGITHGDLSPQNIMYSPPQRALDLDKITLIDIALPIAAQYYESNAESRERNLMGDTEVIDADALDTAALEAAAFDAASGEPKDDTHPPYKVFGQPFYIAPECFRGQRPDRRSDLYSLGVILFELTTGTLPFTSAVPEVIFEVLNRDAPVASIRQNPWPYPPALDALIGNLLSKSPAERCDSIAEVRVQLEQMRDHLSKRYELNMTEEVRHADLDEAAYHFEDTLSDSVAMTESDSLRDALSHLRSSQNETQGQETTSSDASLTALRPHENAQENPSRFSGSHSSGSSHPTYLPKRGELRSARRNQARARLSAKPSWLMNLVWMLLGMLFTFLIRYLYF